MKKLVCVLTVLLIALSFAGCGGSENAMVIDPNATQSQGPNVSAAPAGPDLYFESNGVKIRPYDLIDDVVAGLGEPSKGTFDAPSCAYQGMDVFYNYGAFQLTVNDVDGAKHVTVIMVVDDTVSTPEGVKIGQTEDEMKPKLGGATGDNGLYRVESGKATLQIQIADGKVKSILYTYNKPQ